jgi:hypothetical protein
LNSPECDSIKSEEIQSIPLIEEFPNVMWRSPKSCGSFRIVSGSWWWKNKRSPESWNLKKWQTVIRWIKIEKIGWIRKDEEKNRGMWNCWQWLHRRFKDRWKGCLRERSG